VAKIDSFLRLVIDQRASDLHFMAGSKPLIRHNGDLIPIPFRELGGLEARRFLYEILDDTDKADFERTQELDFAYELTGAGRFRANMFMHRGGIGAVFRIIPERIPTLTELGLPDTMRRIAALKNGLVLFAGPTGCGKTTTQAALIREIDRTRSVHIVTVEDPIEFVHSPVRAVLTQRQVGRHVESFHSGLRSALREAPDVLLVGEMRDPETVSLAMTAAETGILVLGTLHTGSAAKSVDRIVDAYPEGRSDHIRGMLSVTLRAVVAQRLVKLASGDGRVAAVEVMYNNHAVATMIRDGKLHQLEALMQSAESGGMRSLDRALLSLVRERRIIPQEALIHARRPAALKKALIEEGHGIE
jgi:twitching motility protein PilT